MLKEIKPSIPLKLLSLFRRSFFSFDGGKGKREEFVDKGVCVYGPSISSSPLTCRLVGPTATQRSSILGHGFFFSRIQIFHEYRISISFVFFYEAKNRREWNYRNFKRSFEYLRYFRGLKLNCDERNIAYGM